MQMLAAGGLSPLRDDARPADADNPRGYFEFERAKRLPHDAEWLPAARGKAVKLVYRLLSALPREFDYRIVFLQRPLAESLASQRAMLARQGRPTSALDDERLASLFEQELAACRDWLASRENLRTLFVEYHDLLRSPGEQAARLDAFLEPGLDVDAMAAAVDPDLYRQRG